MVPRAIRIVSLAALCCSYVLLVACTAQPRGDSPARAPSSRKTGPRYPVLPAGAGWRDVRGQDYQGVVVPSRVDASFLIEDKPRWPVGDSQIARAEAALGPALAVDREASEIPEKLHLYQRQYIGFLEGRKRRIYINAFCNYPEGMREHIIAVADGGDCYFQAIYDVGTDAIVEVRVNGQA